MTDKNKVSKAGDDRPTTDEALPHPAATDVTGQLTVDEATGRAYDPEGEGGQEAVAGALGKLPAGFDPAAEDRVPAEDKLPGTPPVGHVSGQVPE